MTGTGISSSDIPTRRRSVNFRWCRGTGGYRYEGGRVIVFEPVAEGRVRLGTLYLKSDLHPLYVRLQFYGGIVSLILCGSVLVALVISNALQRRITRPILALAEVAKAVSERGRLFPPRAKGQRG